MQLICHCENDCKSSIEIVGESFKPWEIHGIIETESLKCTITEMLEYRPELFSGFVCANCVTIHFVPKKLGRVGKDRPTGIDFLEEASASPIEKIPEPWP